MGSRMTQRLVPASPSGTCASAAPGAPAQKDQWAAFGAWLLLLVSMGGIVLASFVLTPETLADGPFGFTLSCPTKALFGHACPTCGMSRAMAALAHGRWSDAVHYNLGAPVAYTFIWFGALFGAVQSAKTLRSITRARAWRKS
jgi:hypothetical protein